MFSRGLGLDPEFALVHKETGLARSAHQFLWDGKAEEGAGKAKLIHIEEYNGNKQEGAEMDRDGTGLEVRSLAPTYCRDNIVPYVAEVMRQTQLKLDLWEDGQYMMSTTPIYRLDDVSFEGPMPEDVVKWGCRPDMDAYSLQSKAPDPPKDKRRYTGGHLHQSPIKIGPNDIKQQAAVAVCYDYMVGLPLVAILGDRYAKGEAERRLTYGQAGSYRFNDKVGKLEYRVPSGRLMLSPVLLTWAMGVQRLFTNSFRVVENYEAFLHEKLANLVRPSAVAEIINNHDVAGAEKWYGKIFELFPTFKVEDEALANRLSGGGGSTRNAYFYKKMVDVFVDANKLGLGWEDDVKFNWGLYPDFTPKHHAYWAIGLASVGLLDEQIFPQIHILEKHIPKQFLAKEATYTHPVNGGKWKMHGSAGWLL